ncbi:hypothetical protein CsatB_016698 [Cannabis sativa]
MAKSRGRGRGRPKSSARKTKQLSNVKSKGSLVPEEDLSIAPLALSEDEEEIEGVNEDVFRPLSPKSSLTEILRQEEIRHDFSSFIEANHRCSKDIAAGKSTPIPVLRTGGIIKNLGPAFEGSTSKSRVKITHEDIEDEVSFWKSSLVCYVLGANPPLSVLEGFARRIWKDKIDKVGMLSYGIFLI